MGVRGASEPYVEVAEVVQGLCRVEEGAYAIRRVRFGVEDEVLEGGAQRGELREVRPRARGVCGGGGEVQGGEGAAELLENGDGELVEGEGERAEAREVPHPDGARGRFGGLAAEVEGKLFEELQAREPFRGCAVVLDRERDEAGGRQDERVERGQKFLRVPPLG